MSDYVYNSGGNIIHKNNNCVIPNDPKNADYQAFVASGQTPDPAPQFQQVSLLDYSAAKRYEKEVGGITVIGIPFATDRDSQLMIVGAYSFALRDPNWSTYWKLPNGSFVQINSVSMILAAVAVASHIEQCFTIEATVAAAIANATVTTTDQIDGMYAT